MKRMPKPNTICIDKRITKVKSLHVSPTESWCVGTSPVTAMCTEAMHTELTGEAWLFSISNFEICATAVHFRIILYNDDFLLFSFLFSFGIIPLLFFFSFAF